MKLVKGALERHCETEGATMPEDEAANAMTFLSHLEARTN